MRNRLIVTVVFSCLAAITASAQATDSNPGRKPPVFLGGPKYKKDKPATSRSLKGKVVDESGQPLAGALVTLTDTKSNDKKTFITKEDGRYNFDDLSFTVDYQVQARYKDVISESRKLSQYDHTANMVRILDVHTAPAEAKK